MQCFRITKLVGKNLEVLDNKLIINSSKIMTEFTSFIQIQVYPKIVYVFTSMKTFLRDLKKVYPSEQRKEIVKLCYEIINNASGTAEVLIENHVVRITKHNELNP